MHEADKLHADAHRLTDAEVRTLRGTYQAMSEDPELSRPVREWYGQLAEGMASVLSARCWQWAEVLSDPAVPPSWEVAVAALPPDAL